MSGSDKAKRAAADVQSKCFVFMTSPLPESRFVLGWPTAKQTELGQSPLGQWVTPSLRVYYEEETGIIPVSSRLRGLTLESWGSVLKNGDQIMRRRRSRAVGFSDDSGGVGVATIEFAIGFSIRAQRRAFKGNAGKNAACAGVT